MPFLFDEAFDYNDLLWQTRALARNFPQKNKSTPTVDTDFGVTIDNVVGGAAVGNGRLYICAQTSNAAQGTVVLTAVIAGGDVVQAGVGTERTGMTALEMSAASNWIRDNNAGSSRNFTTDGFVAGGFVKVNGANGTNAARKWNGTYRISSISSVGGGTNNVLNINATDIVGAPASVTTGLSAIVLTPLGTGAAFTVSGTAGVSGLLVAGQRFCRYGYSIIVRTLTNWSITTNADRITTTMGDGAMTRKYKIFPTVDFTVTVNTIKRSTGSWDTDGFRAGGGIFITNAVDAANNGFHHISLVSTTTNPNDTLTVLTALATRASDVIDATPYNSTADESTIVTFAAGTNSFRRTDLGSWKNKGIQPGDRVRIQAAVDAGNNGFHVISDIITGTQVDDTIVVTAASTIATQANDTITITSYFVPERHGDRRFRVATDNVEASTRTSEERSQIAEEPAREQAQGLFNTEWQSDSPGLVFGQGLRDFIHTGYRTYFNNGSSLMNWAMRGKDGYVESSDFSSQPNVSSEKYFTLTDNPFRFLVCCNGDHIRGWGNPTGSTYTHFYMGWLKLSAAKGQHPYPYFVGGSTGVSTETAASVTSSHKAFWDCCDSSTNNNLTAAHFQRVDGVWAQVQNRDTDTEVTAFQGLFCTTPYRNTVNRADSSGAVPDDWHTLWNRICRTLGNLYEVLNIELFSTSPTIDAYGQFHGMYAISGEAQTAQNNFTLNGLNHIVTPNVYRTAKHSWCAYVMDP